MSYERPVGQPEDPYERYRVERMEADRARREAWEQEGEAESLAIGAYLLQFFNRVIDLFQRTSARAEETYQNLRAFKKSLEFLQEVDKSQDSAFLNLLAEQWQKVVADGGNFRRKTPFLSEFKAFVQDVASYPQGEEFTFGYYLTEYAGQKWLPFPYMELIHKLHDTAVKNPDENPLSHWIRRIDHLMERMGN